MQLNRNIPVGKVYPCFIKFYNQSTGVNSASIAFISIIGDFVNFTMAYKSHSNQQFGTEKISKEIKQNLTKM